MKNIKISAVLLLATLFLFTGEASALFDNKYKETAKQLEESEAARALLVKQVSDLEGKCALLEKDNTALKEDRSNFLVRIKQLMDEKNQGKPSADTVKEIESLKKDNLELQKTVKELKTSHPAAVAGKQSVKPDEETEDLKRENILLKKEIASMRSSSGSDDRSGKRDEEIDFLKKENLSLQKEISSMKEHASAGGASDEEMKGLREELSLAQKESAKLHSRVDRLEKENDSLASNKKTNDSMKKELKTASDGLKREKKMSSQVIKERDTLAKDKFSLTEEQKKSKKDYAEAVKKNKQFERDMKNMPKKFAEIARQNIAMRKETSEMHYNLGVFYAKNKEYERAVTEFEKTIDIDPDHANAYFNLGYINAEYLVNRKKAIENFRHYVNLAKSDDKDAEWAKKYILTWQTWEGKQSID